MARSLERLQKQYSGSAQDQRQGMRMPGPRHPHTLALVLSGAAVLLLQAFQ